MQAHDAIERELVSGGNYAPIRDVAAKAAENIARLAALFHMLDHCAAGTIDRVCVDSAAQILRWHLQEAQRLLGDLDAPPAVAAAIRFDTWLRDEAMRTGDGRIPTKRVYRFGPGCVRDSKELKDAVALLAEHGRARLEEEGRRRFCGGESGAVRRLIGWVRTPGAATLFGPGGLAVLAVLAVLDPHGGACALDQPQEQQGCSAPSPKSAVHGRAGRDRMDSGCIDGPR